MKGAGALDRTLTGGRVGKGISGAISAFGGLPSMGGGTIGEAIPKEIEAMSEAYSEWAEENPTLATDVEGAGNLLMVSPFFRYADDIISSTGKLSKIIPKNELKNLSSQEVRAKGTALFKLAEKTGGGVKKKFWTDYVGDMKKSLNSDPDIVKALVGGRNEIDDAFARLSKLGMEAQSFGSLKKFRSALGDLAENARSSTGGATNTSRIYENMKHSLEDKIMTAPDNLFKGGRKAAEIQREARKYWSSSFKLDEIERVLTKAAGKAQPANSMKSGMQRIRDNPKLFNRYNAAEQAAIKKAAVDGTAEGVVKTFGGRLVPVIAASTMAATGGAMVGGPAGAAAGLAGVTALSGISRLAAEGMKRGQVKRVEDIIKLGAASGHKVSLQDAARIFNELQGSVAKAAIPGGAVSYATEASPQGSLADRARMILGVKNKRIKGKE
jgi:hypothetical protein